MLHTQFVPSSHVHATRAHRKPQKKLTTVNGLALIEAIYAEYYQLRCEKLPHEESVDELQESFRLLPEQIECYLALYRAYISPQCTAIAFDMIYLVTIDMKVLFDLQPFLQMYYENPQQGAGPSVRLAQNSITIQIGQNQWEDIAELPYYEFHRWVQFQNGEPVDPPCDDIPF